MLNDRLDRLDEFPFRRLARLLADVTPAHGLEPLDLALGEPQHRPPALLAETVAAHGDSWNRYPPPQGTPEYRAACAAWLERRFALPAGAVEPDRHVLPLAGTKEGLFLLPQLVIGSGGPPTPLVAMPSPAYSVYLGGALMAGAEPLWLPASAASGWLPDLDSLTPDQLDRTALFYLCNPANPQGGIAPATYLDRLVALARRHDFLLVADECYADIYDAEPPGTALAAALRHDSTFRNVVVMHSLSKRSNAAGLRAGFCAGDEAILARFLHLRAYAAAVQPLPLMAAATALWSEDGHVATSREAYRRKIDLAERHLGGRLGFYRPPGGFFLWLDVGTVGLDGVGATTALWRDAHMKVLPGAHLVPAGAPGAAEAGRYIRVALVRDEAVTATALDRLARVLR